MRLRKRGNTISFSRARRRKTVSVKAVGASILGLTILTGVALAILPNAYQITIGGEVIAIVDKKEYIEEALNTIEVQLEKDYKTEVKVAEIEDVKKVHASKKELIDPNKLASYLRAELPIEIEFQNLVVDGKVIGVIESEDVLDTLKDELKMKYFRDKEVEAEFVNKMELEPIFTTEDQLTDLEELVDIASERHKEIIEYTVAPGDSLWLIADKLGVNMLDIISQNEGMTEASTLKIGQVINVQIRVPVVGLELIEPEIIETPEGVEGEEKGVN